MSGALRADRVALTGFFYSSSMRVLNPYPRSGTPIEGPDGQSLRSMWEEDGLRAQRVSRTQRDQPDLATELAENPHQDAQGRDQAGSYLHALSAQRGRPEGRQLAASTSAIASISTLPPLGNPHASMQTRAGGCSPKLSA